MTWFRAGGGGIPASLKNGMNAVLNKKFGTSGQTYAPSDWPDDVNLLGKLPEKTVSGAIASFSDGADDVPIKSLVCNVDANLSGVSSVTVYQTGKNLIDFNSYVRTDSTSGGLSFEVKSNGAIRLYGTTTRTYAYLTYYVPVFLKAGATYTLSRDTAKGYRILLNCTYADNTTGTQAISANATSKTFTPDKDIVQIRLETANMENQTAYDDTVFYMVEEGNQATTYEAYKAKTPITVSLGRTIHGGTADIVNGTGMETYEKKLGSELTWGRHNTGNYFYCTNIADEKASGQQNVIAEGLTTTTTSAMPSTDYSISGRNADGAIFVRLTGAETKEQFEEWIANKVIVFEKATPEDFSFQGVGINSFLGDNNLLADTGDISDCTYRRDIDLALAQLSGTRGLMMASRSVSPMIGEEASLDRENILEEEDLSQNLDSREEVSENSDNEESEEER